MDCLEWTIFASTPSPTDMPADNLFKTSLTNPDDFTITYELVPGQGSGGKQVERLLDFAGRAQADGRVKALSITDNPGGNPALAPVAIGSELLQMGIEPLVHFSLKDKNRSQVESLIFLYQRLQMLSLLVLGGDFPKPGYFGQAKPVYDLDTIQTLQLIQDMENGSYRRRNDCGLEGLDGPRLFKGCVVSPFKTTEAEQVWQYGRLLYKVRAGADFIITQLGFDMAKFAELTLFLKQEKIDLPVLANVFIPSLSVARAMAAGKVPGVLLADQLVAQMEKEASGGNDRARLDRAAATIAGLKKLGYLGVHIGGNDLHFEDLAYILNRVEEAETTAQSNALKIDFPIPGTWRMFETADDKSGDLHARPLHPGTHRGGVKLHELSHRFLFSGQTQSGRLFARFCLFCDRNRLFRAVLRRTELIGKRLLFNCRMCGDCTLSGSTYLCPQSGCPKQLVNGPCGGSRNGSCEVFPERLCFWVRVYGRLEPGTTFHDLTVLSSHPPKDWAMEGSSSWINYFKKIKKSRMQ